MFAFPRILLALPRAFNYINYYRVLFLYRIIILALFILIIIIDFYIY